MLRRPTARKPTLPSLHPILTALFVAISKNAPLYFQQLPHSSQFTKRDISSIFLTLRILWEKHPGVGVPSTFQNFATLRFAPLTPLKSKESAQIPSNPFRIL